MKKLNMLRPYISGLVYLALTFGHAQEEFSQKYSQSKTESVSNFYIDFTDSNDNSVQLPIVIIKGKEPGKTLTVLAGVHGYEYPPIMAVQAFLKEIKPENLKGNIIVVPICNTASFYGRSPFISPKDKVNLNNAFPGKENGTVTQQIAYYITENIIPLTDVFLDIHGGDASEDLIPFVCYYDHKGQAEATTIAEQLSKASGFTNVVSYPYTISNDEPAKYAFKQAVQDGKVGLSFEAGALGNVQQTAVEINKKGIYNVLKELNMYISSYEKPKMLSLYNNQVYLKVPKTGLFYSDVKAGDSIEKDQVVGTITNEFGEVLISVSSPATGTVLYKVGTPPVNWGETLMCIGIPKEQ